MAKRGLPCFQKEVVNLPDFEFMTQAAIHHFTLSNRKEGRWESIYTKGAKTVLIAALTPQEKLVLVRIFRFPIENWILELPGGDVEIGEDLATAARRELQEETGYDSDEPFEKLTQGWLFGGKTDVSFVIYLARNCISKRTPCLDAVEKVQGLEILEQDPGEIMREIGKGNPGYDPPISHALISLLQRRIVKP